MSTFNDKKIIIKGAREHNLKNVDLELPKNKLIVFTGLSGSGKSSLVYDTIYAEGQRRYMESLSSYARQFLERMNRPDVDLIQGISPAIAIEQKPPAKNPRSTVGTTSEIYDYLKILFARIGKTYCTNCNKIVKKDSILTVIEKLKTFENNKKLLITFKLHLHEHRTLPEEFTLLLKKGYSRIYSGKNIYDLNDGINLKLKKESIYVIVERISLDLNNVDAIYTDSLEMSFREGDGRLYIIDYDSHNIIQFSKNYECCGIMYEQPEPRLFTFNNPYGACPKCQGFGKTINIDYDLVIPDKNKTLKDGAIVAFTTKKWSKYWRDLISVSYSVGLRINVPYKELTEVEQRVVVNGTKGYLGIKPFFKMLEDKNYKLHYRVYLSRFRGYTKCDECEGSRLRKEALNIKVDGKKISDLVTLSLDSFYEYLININLDEYEKHVADRILKELIKRTKFLVDLGIGYLTIDRLSSTLSGGETQRINLATSLGSALVGSLYVLDEPSIGLHPRDTNRLIDVLHKLKNLGNSVLIVEHDKDIMQSSDYIVDLGPAAGINGGEVIFFGTYDEILKSEKSITGNYLSEKKSIPLPIERRKASNKFLKIIGARENNLKNIDISIPLNLFVCITGVSGSGKSTLINDILFPAINNQKTEQNLPVGKHLSIDGSGYFKNIEIVDQSPIGRSSRSNPATYTGAFDHIREFFSNLSLSKQRGYKPGFFSFNVPGGRCDTCEGDGYVKIEMQFLADLYLVCEDCKGSRYKKEVHDIKYKGKNLIDVLNMTVDEAIDYFKDQKRILPKLYALQDVGLGYIKIGQPSTTLSGGESQRVKLAEKLLFRESSESTLFIFDEPTTGLHFDDIRKLIICFDLLLKNGHSLIVIEHNMEVIKCADYIIDLGPEAGENGGLIVAQGTPEEICQVNSSHTARFLKPYLK